MCCRGAGARWHDLLQPHPLSLSSQQLKALNGKTITMSEDKPTSSPRLAYYVGVGLMVLVGALQARRVDAGFVTNYGGDIVGPAVLYLALRTGRSILRYFRRPAPGPEAAAIMLFLLCLAWELCQLFDLSGTPLGITRGRFDPFDILAYGLTLLSCYAIDKHVNRNKLRETRRAAQPGASR